jgi:hypothetical protein
VIAGVLPKHRAEIPSINAAELKNLFNTASM